MEGAGDGDGGVQLLSLLSWGEPVLTGRRRGGEGKAVFGTHGGVERC